MPPPKKTKEFAGFALSKLNIILFDEIRGNTKIEYICFLSAKIYLHHFFGPWPNVFCRWL
jgi:hypothetical protein